MAATKPGHKRRFSRLVIILLLAVALMVAANAAFVSANRDWLRFTPFEKDAGDLLKQLITDSELTVTQSGVVNREEADGTQPDMAKQRLVIAATAETVQAGFRQACRRAGLGAPDSLTMGSDPDALCEGDWRGGTVTVSVKLRCMQSCAAVVSVYHFWF